MSRYGRMLKSDTVTDGLITIDIGHHEIHDGHHYYMTHAEDLAAGTSCEVLVSVPSAVTRYHMFFEITVEDESSFKIFEDVTSATSRGISMVAYNNNRNSSRTSDLIMNRRPGGLVMSSAVTIFYNRISAGKFLGEQSRELDERILASGTTYLLRIQNHAAGNNWISHNCSWYEHKPK